ncbi:hypothetical protein [Tabrizicola sp.]|uniref:hypothetical protein n=1 Tax=Tabrizicola sp. TaxID=2005166 RepID=UPI003F2A46F4
MWKRLSAWLDADLAMQQLTHLDDRLLADMGLERESMRERVVRRQTELENADRQVDGHTMDFRLECRC